MKINFETLNDTEVIKTFFYLVKDKKVVLNHKQSRFTLSAFINKVMKRTDDKLKLHIEEIIDRYKMMSNDYLDDLLKDKKFRQDASFNIKKFIELDYVKVL